MLLVHDAVLAERLGSPLRKHWQRSAIAGALALIAAVLFARIPALQTCGPAIGVSPIEAFEIVRSPADVAALFGSEPCRSRLADAERTGLLLDSLWFVPCYVGFLCSAALATGARAGRWIAVAVVIAALCDEGENALLWVISRNLPGTQATIDALFILVRLKFALLALAVAAIAAALASARRLAPVLASLPIAAGGLLSLSGLVRMPNGRLMLGSFVAWAALLLAAGFASLAYSIFAPRVARG